MNFRTRSISVALVLSVVSLSSCFAVGAVINRTAEHCGVDMNQPAQKIFADYDGKAGWREYGSVKDIPELDNGFGSAAFYWSGSNSNVLIQLQEPSEDFVGYTHYCFDRAGKLARLRYELRTAWGWGFREEGTIEKGFLRPSISEFFDTKTEQKVPRPEMADDVRAALKPHLYLLKSELPFSKLLPK